MFLKQETGGKETLFEKKKPKVLLPAKSKPSFLLRRSWCRLWRSTRGGKAGSGGRGNGGLARVANVVPCDVEEDGLHGDERLLRRELDNVGKVDAADGVLVQALDEGRRGGGAVLLLGLAQVVNVHNGAVALELAVDETGQGIDGV